ncbi:hypothetical protein BJ997_001095 [Cryobacterium roopkundense]|uniref:Uncharacterized protein n=1 Tax=Cryobacterium roopkundense TaxID=1001240 RepID=A0A7W8ZV83_9MICO|nr:hypothetical protein [Cryobacterium roopkundense]
MIVHRPEPIDPAALALPPTESIDITPYQEGPGQ